MINMPTTDILTPITGEVDKTLSTDHSDAAEISFLSVITTDDASTDALTALPEQPLVPQTHSKITADFAGLAPTFPAFMPAVDFGADFGASPPTDPLIPQSIDVETPNVPALPSVEIVKDGGDAGLALPVDKRQISNATATNLSPNLGAALSDDLGAAQNPSVDGSKLITRSPAPEEAPLVLKDGTAGVPVKTEPTLAGRDPKITQARGDQPSQTNTFGSMQAQKTVQTMPAPQNAPANMSIATPVVAPVNVAPSGTKLSDEPSVISERPQVVSAVGNVAEQSQKPTIDPQKAPFPAYARSVDTGPIKVQPQPATKGAAQVELTAPTLRAAPAQNLASSPVQARPDGAQMASVKPDTAKASALLAPPSNAPQRATTATPTSFKMPVENSKTSEPESQAQIKQTQPKRTPSRPAQTMQEQSMQAQASQHGAAELTSQAPVAPIAETRSAKQNSQASAVPQMHTSTKGAKTQTAQSADVTTMTPAATTGEIPSATPTVDALESLSTPEIMPFDVKGADSTLALRNDANVNRPEVMRHVAQQLADAARQMPDRPIELALNPEELGRVRLTFTPTENGIHIAVMAERGETMDLLRRHIETLAQEFREMGYKDVKFEFSQNGQNEAKNEDSDGQTKAEPKTAPSQPQSIDPIQLSIEPSAGLDLRL